MFTASQPGRHLRASKITSRSLRVQRRRKSRSAPASSTALATLNYWSLFKAHTGRSDVATPHINSSLKIKRDSCLIFLKKKRRRNGLNSDLWWLGISAPSARWTTLLSGSSPACRRSSKRGEKKKRTIFNEFFSVCATSRGSVFNSKNWDRKWVEINHQTKIFFFFL